MEPNRLAVRFDKHGFHRSGGVRVDKASSSELHCTLGSSRHHRVGEQLVVAQLRAEHDTKNNRRIELAAASALSCPDLRVPADGAATEIRRLAKTANRRYAHNLYQPH